MGANHSSQIVDNSVLNSIAMSCLTENSTNLSASSDQKNTFELIGNTGGTYSGISQVNSSKINVSSLAASVSNNTLQADLISKLSTSIAQTNPAIAIGSSADQAIKTSITNAVNSNITTKNFTNIAATVASSNTIKIMANTGTNVTALSQKNESDLIIGLVNNTTAAIATTVAAQTDASTTGTQTTPGILADITGMFSNMFSSMSSYMGYVIVFIIIIVCGGLYLVVDVGEVVVGDVAGVGKAVVGDGKPVAALPAKEL